ncbi:MAG: hypothetical protein AB1486_34230, partial [Planctomycetota bacterium]
GPGRLVVSTIRSLSATVLALEFGGLEQPLELTRRHPLFSETRRDWVAAEELAIGEWVRTRAGSLELEGVSAVPGVHQVFNLEVDSTHAYFVSLGQVLCHNAGANSCQRGGPATDDAASGTSSRPSASSADAPRGGETAATKAGRQAHKDWDPGEGFEKEVRLPSGKRADAVNAETRTVKELKPDNPRAVRGGEKRVEGYRKELEETTGESWTGTVETYKRDQ